MEEMPIEVASKGIRPSEPAPGSICGGDSIKPAIGKKAARKASGSSFGGGDAKIKSQKVAEGDKAEAGKVKRMGKVSEKYIQRLIKDGLPKIPTFDYLDNHTGSNAPLLRALAASSTASMEKMHAGAADVLDQYHKYGYAEVEIEEIDEEVRWILKVLRKTRKRASALKHIDA